MPKLRQLKLEPFSLALGRKLLAAFPQWEPFVGRVVRMEAGLIAHVLQMDVPSANRNVRQPLRIVAELDRTVIVSWFPMGKGRLWSVDWVGYAYGNPPMDWREDTSGFDGIIEWLREFMREEHVAAVWRQADGTALSGFSTQDELSEKEARRGKASIVRSWRGTLDAGTTPSVPLPTVTIYGDPDSSLGRMVAESLEGNVDFYSSVNANFMESDRAILLDFDWNLALMPSATHFACSDGRRWTVTPEEQMGPRLFIVRWEGDEWDGPWEEEGSFEVRNSLEDKDLLRRHLLAWLREP